MHKEAKTMHTRLLTAFLVVSALLAGAGIAGAVDVNWKIVQSAAVAGHTPGVDKLIGTLDDATTDTCNFSNAGGCATGPMPSVGTYSYSFLDYQLTHSCGLGTGGPCTCSTGGPCTSDGDCSGGGCGGSGDCCKGIVQCEPCEDGALSYFGVAGSHGVMDTCQAYTSGNYQIKKFDVATSETVPGEGGDGCIQLVQPGGPYVGTGCGLGPVSGSIDVVVYAGGCPSALGFTIRNVVFNGNVVDYGTATGVSCNLNGLRTYSGDNWTGLKTAAQTTCGSSGYLELMCGTTTLPASPLPCFEGAQVQFVTVACTSDPDRASCPPNGCQ
jgi:hypothetical protein